MAINPATAPHLQDAKDFAQQVAKAKAAIDPKFKDVTGKLVSAMQAKDGAKIELYLSALEGRLNDIERVMQVSEKALRSLGLVQLDKDFVAENLADVEAVVTIVSEARSGLTKQYEVGKELENKGEKAALGAKDAAGEAMRELVQLDREMDETRDEFHVRLQKSAAFHTQAVEAAKRRDAQGLAKAREAHDGFVESVLYLHRKLMERVKLLGEKAGSKAFGPDLQAALRDGVKDIQKKASGVDAYLKQLVLTQQSIKALTIVGIDVKKAAKVLSLDREGEAQLGKVLGGAPAALESGLEQIGKRLDPKRKGKEMLAALRKAGVL